MVHYRIYARNNLEYIDGGVVKDYSIDYDIISNNTSTASIINISNGFKGDIIALIDGSSLVELGVITSIDNTEKKISFKHMKELFNDTVINVFKFTDLLNCKFDGVQGLKVILNYAFINIVDVKKKLPLEIRTFGSDTNCVYTTDEDTINILDFIDWLFNTYNIYLDFSIDFVNNKIVCTIIKNSTEGYVIKDNIKLSKPEFDNNDMPTYNKVVFYNSESGVEEGTYYLLSNNEVSSDLNDEKRVLPTQTKYVSWDETEAIKEGYSMQDKAESELCGNIYNHCILYKLAKKQTMINCKNFNYGDKVTIVYKDREYESIFTGLKYTMYDPYYTCIFGKTRIDFTDRMKIYNDKRYRRKT